MGGKKLLYVLLGLKNYQMMQAYKALSLQIFQNILYCSIFEK